MRVAIITSNNVSINNNAKKGTEIFAYILIKELAKKIEREKSNIHLTAFASGDSQLPVKIESVKYLATTIDPSIPDHKHIIFELALLSKAFSMHKKFDIYHINIGDGDIAMPFTPFVNKPILITLHNTPQRKYLRRYFPLFKKNKKVFFISISNAQRKFFPKLNFIQTIYHGIDTSKNFTFDPKGGDRIMWAGRAIPKKGMDTVITVAERTKHHATLYPLMKSDYHEWFETQIEQVKLHDKEKLIHIKKGIEREDLGHQYQNSKLLLFPLKWEEPFGLVLIESMACGTPVIAYARGSVPEIVKDGETGFIINPSNHDRRGEWIIKKTGLEGLQEAVERIYTMPEKEYQTMRSNCRMHVEKHFTVERMVNDYVEAYKKALQHS